MTHWREPHVWKRGLGQGDFGNFSEPTPKPQITDWSVFWLTVGLAIVMVIIGMATAGAQDWGTTGLWQIRADSAETFAVFRNQEDMVPAWSLRPDALGLQAGKPHEDFCHGIVEKYDAEWLAHVLNKRDK